MAKESWQEQPSPYEYIQEMQKRIVCVAPVVMQHMEAAQAGQCRVYNHPAQPREFWPDDRVLFLLLSATCTFLACWWCPITVLGWVGPVNYCLQQRL